MLATATDNSTNNGDGLPFLPSVVSMSLGSLSFDSCELLCSTLVTDHPDQYSSQDCDDYMATQRQVGGGCWCCETWLLFVEQTLPLPTH